jgi:hypothetical protein
MSCIGFPDRFEADLSEAHWEGKKEAHPLPSQKMPVQGGFALVGVWGQSPQVCLSPHAIALRWGGDPPGPRDSLRPSGTIRCV